ncbi:MAG TPA: UvrD-helicase domain-containing protein [Candidatus Saccharimonadales bacterium]|nr:UvrD-helicase domain-containing protein [Candidatus Saccharimonadales bacterium]
MDLNSVQRQAVEHPGGPLLILAGAGSGKTRVLTGRIAHLVRDRGIPQGSILAFTFTNKAAREMRARAQTLLGREDLGVWLGTFHGTCVRILRRHAELLGYPKNFVIYDTDDQRSILRDLLKGPGPEDKSLTPAGAGSRISRLKNEDVSPDEFQKTAFTMVDRRLAGVYASYQKALRDRGAMDFDDLIGLTVRLFDLDEEIHRMYATRFLHVLVDEYQDTNAPQFRLIESLARIHRNLTVVGDDDQSIYGWRGADVANILSFEKSYPDASVLRLTQNYRSTQTILSAANGVVKHNTARKEKELWTENAVGEKIRVHLAEDEEAEGERMVSLLLEVRRELSIRNGDVVVLYRTNAQSRAVENALRRSGIPYQLTGGISFYERREVKDVLAYMRALVQPRDTVSWYRILNVPPRAIGRTTLDRFRSFAEDRGLTVPEALGHRELVPVIGAAAARRLQEVGHLFTSLTPLLTLSPPAFLAEMIAKIRYREYLLEENPAEAAERIENVDELIAGAEAYLRRAEDPTVEGFLSEVALLTDVDQWNDEDDTVNLMTIHSAKGLEFPVVFVMGLEEGLLPHSSSLEDPAQLEEERRLFYVALTRAQRRVDLFHATFRRAWNAGAGGASRFLSEIPTECIDWEKAPWAEPKPVVRRRPREEAEPKRGGKGSPVGVRVIHPQFGEGVVVASEGVGERAKLTVNFRRAGTKKILAAFAELSHAD